MKSCEIIPHVGVGPIRFGMTRAEVRTVLGNDVSVIRKWPYTREIDAYDALGVHLEYDSDDKLICVEAWGSCPIHYKDCLLLNASAKEVLQKLADLGLRSRYDDGYFFDDGGFMLYCPHDIIKAVTVYRPAYYDEAV